MPSAPDRPETILIIEDDPTMRRALKDNFEFEGYHVRAAADGETGLQAVLEAPPDLIVLDIMLPGINGYELCRLIREEGIEVPVIMLTAKGQESDIVLGLNLGADDYVTKPFSIKELLARANAFLRRRRNPEEHRLTFGTFTLDLDARTLHHGDEEMPLTPKEFAVLALLAGRPGRAFTRDEILRSAWGYDVWVSARSVDRCINTLRRKIELDRAHPAHIQTVREIGYRFSD